MKKVLIIVTSHDELGNTCRPTGLWLDEFTAPYYQFRDAGYEVLVASPHGGRVPVDPESFKPEAMGPTAIRWQNGNDPVLERVFRLEEVAGKKFDALFYPGGHGPMWDLAEDPVNAELLEKMYDSGKVIGAVCHGPAALLHCVRCDGHPLVFQRNVTGFSNAEEQQIHLETVVPFLLEDELKAEGGRYSQGEPWKVHVVVDGNLVTGQNPHSAEAVGKAMIQLLEE